MTDEQESELANLVRAQEEEKMAKLRASVVGAGFTYPYGNRYYIWANNNIVRVLIGDSINEEDPSWKSIFAMSRSDAKNLADSILELLRDTDTTPNTDS